MCAVNAIDLLLIAAAFSSLSAVRPPTVRAVPGQYWCVCPALLGFCLCACVCVSVVSTLTRSLAAFWLINVLHSSAAQDATPAAGAVSADTDVGRVFWLL